jgi:hypothetical protein
MKRLGAAVLIALSIAGCGGGSSGAGGGGTASTVNVGGTIAVDDVAMGLHKCNPRWAESNDYAVPGATVTVYDAAGKIVGTTSLGFGKPAYTNGTGFKGCAYTYGLTVPASAFYQVQVGSDGEKTTFTQDAARQGADIKITNVNG